MGAGAKKSALWLDPDSISRTEKRYYLMALITLAGADGFEKEELKHLKQAAGFLGVRLTRKDLQDYDLREVAIGIQGSNLRKRLLDDLVRLAGADQRWEKEELEIIHYLANEWKMSPPELPEVNWGEVSVADEARVKRASERHRSRLTERASVVESLRPGFRWEFALAATGLYLLCLMAIGMVALLAFPTVVEQIAEGKASLLGGVLAVGTAFVAGLLIGWLSPGRTLREPAAGVVIPLVMMWLFTVLMAKKLGVAQFILQDVALYYLIGTVVMYAATLAGAWVGEEVQEQASRGR